MAGNAIPTYRQTDLRMDDAKRELSGSSSRDLFKLWHKQALPTHMFACDLDLLLIEKNPYQLIALLDVKRPYDKVTFTEVIAYNEFVRMTIPVFVLYAQSDDHMKAGRYTIKRYISGDPAPRVPTLVYDPAVTVTQSVADFAQWENRLRQERKRELATQLHAARPNLIPLPRETR